MYPVYTKWMNAPLDINGSPSELVDLTDPIFQCSDSVPRSKVLIRNLSNQYPVQVGTVDWMGFYIPPSETLELEFQYGCKLLCLTGSDGHAVPVSVIAYKFDRRGM